MASSTGSKSESNSPVPPGSTSSGTPSPLIIGKSFIKQYYQVLSTNPEQITKFYKADSVLSHSLQPSVPTIPKTLASSAEQFFQWAKSSKEDEEPKLCFDFGSGAIDAQESINGGILLVVTGHIILPNQSAKTFVHTFFLNNGAAPGKKRQFYVHNDILRFLEEGSHEETTTTASEEEHAAATAAVTTGTDEIKETPTDTASAPDSQEVPVAQSPPVVLQEAKEKDQGTQDASSSSLTQEEEAVKDVTTEASDMEKSKDKVDDDNDAAAATVPVTDSMEGGDAAPPQAKDDKKPKKSRSRGRSRKSRSSSPTDADKKGKAKAKEPGSWASLVAGNKPSAVAAAAAEVAAKLSDVSITSSSQDQKKKASEQKESAAKAAPSEASKEKSTTGSGGATQRTPEATVLIKNLPDKSKESEIRAMFKPYADKLNKKILGITLLASRGFAFVDFDSKVVVEAVVKDAENEKKGQEKFVLNGKVLDVGRKVPQESSKVGSNSGQNRSKSPGAQKNKGGRRHSPRGGNRSKK